MGTLRLEPARIGGLNSRAVSAVWSVFDVQLAVYAFALITMGLLMAFTNSDGPPLEAGSLFTRGLMWLSLAIVAFQCIVGCLPFRRDSFADLVVALHTDPAPVPSSLAEGIPRGFDAWFARAVRRSPDERYQSTEELITTLGEALALR